MRIAIRDDDISYWTNASELNELYDEVFNKGIKISFAVIPFSVKSYNLGDWNRFYQDEELKPIHENKELIYYLREKILSKNISIMLHGFSHQYKVAITKKGNKFLATGDNLKKLRNTDGKNLLWFGEYSWKKYEDMQKETRMSKEYIEDLFHTKISVFVPPSNDISKSGVKAVSEAGLNLSGTIHLKKYNRPKNIYSFKNWFNRAFWKIYYKKQYPYLMNYKTHKELVAYGLVPGVEIEELKKQLEFCYRKKSDFVLATHNWEVKKNIKLNKIFYDFIKYSQDNSFDFLRIDDLYENLFP